MITTATATIDDLCRWARAAQALERLVPRESSLWHHAVCAQRWVRAELHRRKAPVPADLADVS